MNVYCAQGGWRKEDRGREEIHLNLMEMAANTEDLTEDSGSSLSAKWADSKSDHVKGGLDLGCYNDLRQVKGTLLL